MGITPVQFSVAAGEHAPLNNPPIDEDSPTVRIQRTVVIGRRLKGFSLLKNVLKGFNVNETKLY